MFAILSMVYAATTLSVLPWARQPLAPNPQIAAVAGAGVLAADFCTALLLGVVYRRTGRLPVLILVCAYLYGSLMAALHVVTFPNALLSHPLIGNDQTVGWMFNAWRAGMALLFLVAVRVAGREPLKRSPGELTGRLVLACAATVVCAGLITVGLSRLSIPESAGNRFLAAPLAISWVTVAIYALTVVLIWRRRAFDEVLYLWLGFILVASMTDLTLSTASGARYTVGWYVGRASWVVSAWIFCVFWLRELSHTDRAGALRIVAAYGGALGVTVAALLLRWFLNPWMGPNMPFGTIAGSVAIAVWLGGWGPATLAAVVGFIAGTVLFVEPIGKLAIASVGDLLGLVMYSASSALIIGLGEAMRRARDRHRRSEERFRGSQEASLQGYAFLKPLRDPAGRITDFRIEYVNPRGAMMAGGTPAEFAGRSLLAAMPRFGACGLFDALLRVSETGEPSDTEQSDDAEDAVRWFRTMAVKVGDGVAMSYSDVSEKRRLETALTARAAELQRADANKSQFLAILSHELRNPLAPLRNGLTLLQMKGGAGSSAEIHAMMERQFGQLTRLIDDLLDVSRIDRGMLQLQRERLTIDSVVRDAIETAKPSIEAKSHELVVRYATQPLHVDGDRVRLTQVVSNLLINAAKFTPVAGRIEVSMRAEGGEAAVSIADNGIGLAPENLRLIFDMFVQLDRSKTQASTGLGLGLTLVRSIVEAHGGRVEARSPGPDQGSDFTFRLPLAAASPDREQEDAVAAAPGKTPRSRILVVDDNVDAANSLAELLRLDGHSVLTSFDGSEAFRSACRFKPNLAFIDLNMPGMDGIELARRLRGELPEITLIALTGMGQPNDIQRTREAGYQSHMTKPASPEEVLRMAAAVEIRNVVPFKRPAQ